MVSIGMVLNVSGEEEEAAQSNILIKNVKLPGGMVHAEFYLGLDNRIFEEIDSFFRQNEMDLHYKDYEMVVTTAEGSTVLEPMKVVEHYCDLLRTPDIAITVRPLTKDREEPKTK